MTPRGHSFEHLELKNDSNMKIESLTCARAQGGLGSNPTASGDITRRFPSFYASRRLI